LFVHLCSQVAFTQFKYEVRVLSSVVRVLKFQQVFVVEVLHEVDLCFQRCYQCLISKEAHVHFLDSNELTGGLFLDLIDDTVGALPKFGAICPVVIVKGKLTLH